MIYSEVDPGQWLVYLFKSKTFALFLLKQKLLIKCKLVGLKNGDDLLEITMHPDFYKGKNQRVLVTSSKGCEVRQIKVVADNEGEVV